MISETTDRFSTGYGIGDPNELQDNPYAPVEASESRGEYVVPVATNVG
jgi:hypothetical protein